MAKQPYLKQTSLDDIFLDLKNPRFKPINTEAEVIDYLCREENIVKLAKDIVQYGLNPIEQFALIQDGENFIVAEGNRRICALKLLDDPDRAPAKFRKPFLALSENWTGIETLPCVVFKDRLTAKPWLSRIHDGEQDGIGRSKWDARQSQRHSGSTKNRIAAEILDYVEENGLVAPDKLKQAITTVQRYLIKKPIQEAMGIDASDLDNIRIVKSETTFDKMLIKFFDDLQSGRVNSRTKGKAVYKEYAEELSSIDQSGDEPAKPKSLGKKSAAKQTETSAKRTKPKAKTTISYEQEIMDGLIGLDNQKLISLYSSITTVKLNPNTPLLSIGAWAFIESLSELDGRKGTDIANFFSDTRLKIYKIDKGKGKNAYQLALKNLLDSSNVTKHDGVGANFNSEQLVNNMDSLKNLIVKCIENITLEKKVK